MPLIGGRQPLAHTAAPRARTLASTLRVDHPAPADAVWPGRLASEDVRAATDDIAQGASAMSARDRRDHGVIPATITIVPRRMRWGSNQLLGELKPNAADSTALDIPAYRARAGVPFAFEIVARVSVDNPLPFVPVCIAMRWLDPRGRQLPAIECVKLIAAAEDGMYSIRRTMLLDTDQACVVYVKGTSRGPGTSVLFHAVEIDSESVPESDTDDRAESPELPSVLELMHVERTPVVGNPMEYVRPGYAGTTPIYHFDAVRKPVEIPVSPARVSQPPPIPPTDD